MGAGISDAITEDPLITGAVLAVLTVIVWSLFVIRRMARDDMSARRRIAELETAQRGGGRHCGRGPCAHRLARPRQRARTRQSAPCMGPPKLPQTSEALLDFAAWLDRDSATGTGRARGRAARRGTGLQHRRPHPLGRIARGRWPHRRRSRHAALPPALGRAARGDGAGRRCPQAGQAGGAPQRRARCGPLADLAAPARRQARLGEPGLCRRGGGARHRAPPSMAAWRLPARRGSTAAMPARGPVSSAAPMR